MPPRQTLGNQGGERPRIALAFPHLFSLSGWFAGTLWSPFSMSAHSKLLTVNTDGSMPATEEATRKTALGSSGFSWCDILIAPSTGSLQRTGLCVLGVVGRKKAGRWGGGEKEAQLLEIFS